MAIDLRNRLLALLPVVALVLLLPASRAEAGCGCDHPPPDWTVVMPPFASAGKSIDIFAAAPGDLVVGETYRVDFGSGSAVSVAAERDDRLSVVVPGGLNKGPAAIRVTGPGYDVQLPTDAFTVLSKQRRIKNRSGVFRARSYRAAVGADGTLYIPINLKRVADPFQFAMSFHGIALVYGQDDVTIYNADGVDLTLFTLDVNDPTQHQWGSYYGWTVESDNGLFNSWYESKSADWSDDDVPQVSPIFTYWRHEFHTYKAAHAPGGTHETSSDGFHPDGTLHVDHDNLVIAIHAVERDPSNPSDPALFRPLDPGTRTLGVGWVSIQANAPVEVPQIVPQMRDADDDLTEELEETLFGED